MASIPSTDKTAQRLWRILTHYGITLVLDVGANIGQFAVRLRHAGYLGPIVSFEALPEAYHAVRAAAQDDPHWQVAERYALGEREGQTVLFRSGETDMSSILPLRADMHQLLDSAVATDSLEVPMHRLDTIFTDYGQPTDRVFLKVDTQGYDLKVLEGATGIFECVALIQLELALVVVYEGEPTWLEAIDYLRGVGFSPILLTPGYFNRRQARLFSVDGIFARV